MARERLGFMHGVPIMFDPLVGAGLAHLFTVTGSVSGGTQFGAKNLNQFPNDFFNDDWVVYVISATNITGGTVVGVTDFVQTNGVVTVKTAGANWAAGDQGYLVPGALLGNGVGKLITIQKASTITPTTGGADLTGTAVGDVLIESIAFQKITDESNDVNGLIISSNDTKALSLTLRSVNGTLIRSGGVGYDDLSDGAHYEFPINWKLASGKKLTVTSLNANGTADYIWTIRARGLIAGASLATA